MANTAKAPIVCVPVKLDAFVLDSNACGNSPSQATLAPLSQPNYTFLRLDSALVQPDVIPLHDLHNASPAALNPRVTDLATGRSRVERQGIYLHWMLPRFYRTGSAQDKQTDSQDLRAPRFRTPPDRWLVVRRLHPGSFQPADVVQKGLMKELTAWVVESNRLRNIEDFDRNIDIELECAPYISGGADTSSLDGQAEVFVGKKTSLDQWKEESTANPSAFIPLDVSGAANPLFADYTPHNSNVFSMLDNFSYTLPDQTVHYLSQATASYYVIGWHASSSTDPLAGGADSSVLSVMLNELKLTVQQPQDPKQVIDITALKPSGLLTHGAMYSVKYPAPNPAQSPANQAASKFSDPHSHPVTVGTTPLDAMLAYLRAHQSEEDAAGISPQSPLRVTEADLLHLETLLLKQDESVDAQQEASDMLSTNNFAPVRDSGGHWSFSAASNSGTTASTQGTKNVFVPTAPQVTALETVNLLQKAYDTTSRQLQSERWNLFAKWWTYIADDADINTPNKLGNFQRALADNVKLVKILIQRVAVLKGQRDHALNLNFPTDSSGKRVVAMGSMPRFYSQKDPTILVPGVPNPWPVDWSDALAVRLSQHVAPTGVPSGSWSGLTDMVTHLPVMLQDAAKRLANEFFYLHPPDSGTNSWKPMTPVVNPLYHDGRDQWGDSQAWFPLFLEWEARYYHVPWNNWKFQDKIAVDPIPGNPLRTRYGIAPGKTIEGSLGDERVITGRVLILPQPGYNLGINIQNLFLATKVTDLPDDLQSDQQQKDFVKAVQQFPYLSAPLAGMIDHLITKINGTHVRPTVRLAGQPVTPLPAAIKSSANAGFDAATISLMDIETAKLPFANFVEFDNSVAPFKPVTHGQFKFTRLDIFDKFGQAISAINSAPAKEIPRLLPALSEYFHPQHQTADPKQAITVGRNLYGECQYAQFPPNINQDARLNASFLSFDAGINMWRPCTEWENPVWGYVLVNYAEYAVQIFLPTGEFYREIRLGGPNGTTSISCLPADIPDKRPWSKDHPQLDNLLNQLKDEKYIRSFVQMINNSLQSIQHAPDTYADFLNAIIGRPLALVNMGFSVELAAPPLANQSTQSSKQEPLAVTDYPFSIKIGDKDRVYDGLVGYFNAKPNFENLGNELDLSRIFTYYPPTTSTSPTTVSISDANYPTTKPYYASSATADLAVEGLAGDKNFDAVVKLAKQKELAHHSKLQMFGALIDPFSKVHLYSGILPIASLQLPQWSLQKAMQKMTAFFHAGPLLITTRDLQTRYNSKSDVTPDMAVPASAPVTVPDATTATNPFKGVPIPAMKSADWSWLQPFAQSATDNASGKATHLNAFDIAPTDNKPKFERGPYTAVEGFMLLRHAVMTPETR